jgi:outer membrane protein TolC
VVIAALAVLAGCHPQQPFYFHETGDMSRYRGMATEIEYPDAKVDPLADAECDKAPLTISNPEPKEVWDLKLEEAMKIALANAKVMKQLGASVVTPVGGTGPAAPNFLIPGVANETLSTIYTPALAESDPRTGVEAALSAFDAQLDVTSHWQKVNEPQNSYSLGSYYYPNASTYVPSLAYTLGVLNQDTAAFQARLQKVDAAGGIVSVSHEVDYLASGYLNSDYRFPFKSTYLATVTAAIEQPLLKGAGVEFNRIAGPGATPGNFNGVVLARLNTDIALANFEGGVRNLVSSVEDAYWELYYTYRALDAVLAGRNSALTTWRRIYALYQLGAKGGEADREAQAREQYFQFRASAERGLVSVYQAEANLRYIMGIASTDGRLIRPADEPTTAKIDFDWNQIHNEAMVRSVELRQQRWVVKRREMELIASKNFLLPTLNAVAKYKWLGLGDELDSVNASDVNGQFSSAYGNLMNGGYGNWEAGFDFSMPLGFRQGTTGVRNAQLQLTRDRAFLQEAELELSHQLAHAIRELDAQLTLSETNFNRRVAADRQVKAVEAAYNTGTVTIDVLLNAQRQLALAESDYYRSVTDYNKAITKVHYTKGSLLEYNGVFLAEGPWPGKAYFDACRQARARDAGHYIDYGVTRPQVISRGPYAQQVGPVGMIPDGAMQQGEGPTKAAPQPGSEEVPTPPVAPKAGGPSSEAQPQESAPKVTPAQASGPRLVPPQAQNRQVPADPTVQQSPATGARRRYALENMNLEGLTAAGSATTVAPEASTIQQTSFQQPVNTRSSTAGESSRWIATRSDSSNEPVANTSAAQSDRAASGWRRAND